MSAVVVEKLNENLINVGLVKAGLPMRGRDVGAKAKALEKHYEQHEAQLAECDVCGCTGPLEATACPFCGDESPVDGAPAPPPESRLSGAPPADPEVVEAAAELVPRFGGDVVAFGPAGRDATLEERRLDRAVERAHVFRAEMKGSGWDLGNALREIEDGKLYLARRDLKQVPVYPTFEKFVAAEFDCSATWARSLIDVARSFTREQAMALGPSKLVPLLRVSGDERQRLLEAAPEMSTREIAAEVRAVAGGERRETGREAPEGLKQGRGRAQYGTKARVQQHVRETPKMPDPVIFPRPVSQEAEAEARAEKRGKPKPRKLTVIASEGVALVPLWARRKTPGDRRRAKSLADEPKGRLRFPNGTEAVILVREGDKGMVVQITFGESRDAADE